MNISIVNGATLTGRTAANGSTYCVKSTGVAPLGSNHPCGALWITDATPGATVGAYAPNGSMYVCDSPYNPTGARRVTVVSGTL